MLDDYDDPRFGAIEFAENPEQRCACVLLLDVSTSMQGEKIGQLNAGLKTFTASMADDAMALKRVEIAVITFGGQVQLVSEFCSPAAFQPPLLRASGGTPLGEGIRTAVKLVEDRKAQYRQNGVSYYRPWIFMITDGEPTDAWDRAAKMVADGEARKAFSFFAVGVYGADMDTLSKISVREPLNLNGLNFTGLFKWLSSSLSAVSRSNPGMEIALANPAAPDGWATTN